MNHVMKITTLLFVLFYSTVFSQPLKIPESNPTKLSSAQELYNERGYSTAQNVTWTDNLVVSTMNGNPSYVLPLATSKVNGATLATTLTYNANVTHTTFNTLHMPGTSYFSFLYWEKLTENRPEWILGVNGFAVQVLHRSSQFCSKPYTYNSSTTQAQGQKFGAKTEACTPFEPNIWMIDGYNFGNQLGDAVRATSSLENGPHSLDKISILRADGGILTLAHSRVNHTSLQEEASYNVDAHTGVYYPLEQDSKGYAVVSCNVNDNSNSPFRYKDCLIYPRTVRYFPGDGNEYVFEEYPLDYGTEFLVPSSTAPMTQYYLSSDHYTLGFPTYKPTVFYLTKINCALGNIATFKYKHYTTKTLIPLENQDESNYENYVNTYFPEPYRAEDVDGRATLQIGGDINDFSMSATKCRILTTQGEYKLELATQKGNNAEFNVEGGMPEVHGARYSTRDQLWSSADNNYSFSAMVTQITDPANRVYQFQYETQPSFKLYKNVYPGYISAAFNVDNPGVQVEQFTKTCSFKLTDIWQEGKHVKLNYFTREDVEVGSLNPSLPKRIENTPVPGYMQGNFDCGLRPILPTDNAYMCDPAVKNIVSSIYEYDNNEILKRIQYYDGICSINNVSEQFVTYHTIVDRSVNSNLNIPDNMFPKVITETTTQRVKGIGLFPNQKIDLFLETKTLKHTESVSRRYDDLEMSGDDGSITTSKQDLKIVTETFYEQILDPIPIPVTPYYDRNVFSIKPIKQVVKSGESSAITSYTLFDYQYTSTDVRDFNSGGAIDNDEDAWTWYMGRDVQIQTTTQYYPDAPGLNGNTPVLTNKDYYKTITEYRYFPLCSKSTTLEAEELTATSLQKRIYNTIKSGGTKESALGTVKANQLQTTTKPIIRNVPPIFGVVTKEKNYYREVESANSLQHLRTIEYVYPDISCSNDDILKFSRNQIVSVREYGRDENQYITKSTNDYWWHNLLKSSTNANGSKVTSFYTGGDIPGYTAGTPMVNGMKIFNDGTNAIEQFPINTSGAFYFGLPVAVRSAVRKWDDVSQIVQKEFTDYKLYNTSFPIPTTSIDVNGYASFTEIDGIGRLKKLTLPLDVQLPNRPNYKYEFKGIQSFSYISSVQHYYEGFRKICDCLNCSAHPPTFTRTLFPLVAVLTDNNLDGIDDNIELGKCYVDRDVIDTNPLDWECSGVKSFPGTTIQTNTNHTATLIPSNSIYTPTVTSITRATLILNITNIKQKKNSAIIGFRVVSDDIGFSKTYFNMKKPNPNYNNFVSGRLPIDVTGFVTPQILNNNPPKFKIEPVGLIDNLEFSVTPTLEVDGEFVVTNPNGDNTLEYTYNDADFKWKDVTTPSIIKEALSVTKRAKIDDIRTNPTIPPLDISNNPFYYPNRRNTWVKNYFGYELNVNESKVSASEDGKLNGNSPNTYLTSSQVLTSFGKPIYSYDVLGKLTKFRYSPRGQLVETTLPDGTVVTTLRTYKFGSEVATFLGINFNDISPADFHGMCFIEEVTDQTGKKNAKFYDVFGRLRFDIASYNPNSALNNDVNLTTKYWYDNAGRLSKVVTPNLQTTSYYYDNYGRVLYKQNIDIGTTSYSYDDVGNVRFVQTQQQADDQKITFTQYDDLNRPTVVGEADFTSTLFGITVNPMNSFQEGVNKNGVINPSRLTNNFRGNKLYNGYTDPVTVNRTLYAEGNIIVPTFGSRIGTTCMPDIINGTSIVQSALDKCGYRYDEFYPTRVFKGVAEYWNQSSEISSTLYPVLPDQNRIENAIEFPQFVRMVMQYDELPTTGSCNGNGCFSGKFWKGMISPTTLNNLCPTGTVRNLKGKLAAVAYRSYGQEAMHYVFYSYDERGRVESMIRYNENIGVTAVYYKYNSMNQIVSIQSGDFNRCNMTQYAYDWKARLQKVWSKLSIGAGSILPNYFTNNWQYPVQPPYPSSNTLADVEYKYNSRNQIEIATLNNVAGATTTATKYYYDNNRGWLNGMLTADLTTVNSITELTTANMAGIGKIYSQKLNHDDAGLITSIDYVNNSAPLPTNQTYTYDLTNRVVNWSLDNNLQASYIYDRMGNRKQQLSSTVTQQYNYFQVPLSSPILYTNKLDNVVDNLNIRDSYTYNADGALTQRVRTDENVTPFNTLKTENFGYDYRGLTTKYKSTVDPTSIDCTFPTNGVEPRLPFTYTPGSYEWHYRYNEAGEREQKRLYYSQTSDTCKYAHAWVYYALDADNRQLATYVGMQTATQFPALDFFDNNNTCINTDRNVYFWAGEYNSYGANGVAVQWRSTPTGWVKYYPITDHLGSTRLVLKQDGTVSSSHNYEPFGKEITSGTPDRLSFIGKEKDAESKCSDFGVRKYDENLGRFLSVDPLWEKYRAFTPYHYCFNSPLVLKDANGFGPGDGIKCLYDCSEVGGGGGEVKAEVAKARKNATKTTTTISGITVDGRFGSGATVGGDAKGVAASVAYKAIQVLKGSFTFGASQTKDGDVNWSDYSTEGDYMGKDGNVTLYSHAKAGAAVVSGIGEEEVYSNSGGGLINTTSSWEFGYNPFVWNGSDKVVPAAFVMRSESSSDGSTKFFVGLEIGVGIAIPGINLDVSLKVGSTQVTK